MANAVLLVMQNPKPGQEAAYKKWYKDVHLGDVCGVPGVLKGEFASAIDSGESPRWSNASYYPMRGDPTKILGEVFKRAQSGDWELSDALDTGSAMMAIGEALTGRVRSKQTPDASGEDRLLFIVMTNCTPGDDEAFNAWYNDQHIPDVLDVPGFVAAQRFRLVDHPAFPAYPYRYLAIYELLKENAAATLAELTARGGTDKMVLSPTLDINDVHAVAFTVEKACEGTH